MTELSEQLIHQKYWLEKKSLLQTSAELEIDHPVNLVIYMRRNDIPLRQKDKALYSKYTNRHSKYFIKANKELIRKRREIMDNKLIDAIIRENEKNKLKPKLTPEQAKEKLNKLNKLIEEYSKRLDKDTNVP